MKAHIAFSILQTTWQGLALAKRKEIKEFFQRFTSGNIVPFQWQKIGDPSVKRLMIFFNTADLVDQVGKENITQAKIDAALAQLSVAGLSVAQSDDPYIDAKEAGWEPIPEDDTP